MTKKIGTSGSSSKFRYLLGASAAALAISGASSAMAETDAEEIAVTAANTSAVAATAAVTAIQQDGDLADEDRDVVVVTGSRIVRPVDSTIDVSTIGSEEFDTRAFTNPLEAIDELPIGGFGNFSPNNQGANTQRGDNGAFPDLLNIGTNRTLTLVDGRRFVGSTQATVFVPGNANGVQVDLSIINPGLIERTEVLIGSGGPIYGADAVAGVVNVILKDDYEGLRLYAQGGITQEGDGENFRVNGLWGKNFDGGRGNFTISGEYLHAERIQGTVGGDRPLDKGISSIRNPLSQGGSDGIADDIYIVNSTNPLQQPGGLLALRSFLNTSSATQIFPNNSCTGATGALATFCAGTGGQNPFQYAQANPGIDPNLFLGTFGTTTNLPRIANPDAMTSGILPFLAVPLTFDSSGALVPADFGSVLPPNAAAIGETIGSAGFSGIEQTNIQSGQERYTGHGAFKYELSDNITFKTDLIFSTVKSDSVGATGSAFNSLVGSSTAGTRSNPVYIDQNPFLSQANRDTLNQLEADGVVFPTIGGERVVFLSTDVLDVISADAPGKGGVISGDELTTWRTASVLQGDFEQWGRAFNWDVSFVYGVTTATNFTNREILDVEYQLAIDVVDDGGTLRCRQQTLGAPEALEARNPDAAFFNTGLATPITPTQAQIDACVPLNLFGEGGVTQAAIDYVTAPSDNDNKSQQFYGAASFGGELFKLPAGYMLFNSQFEWRREVNEFNPGPVFGLGLGRSTQGQPSQGSLRFFEGGTEFVVPIFGGDVRPFAFNMLELEGAVRVVNRSISSDLNPAAAGAPSPTDVTFTAGGRWSPFEGITFRGNRTRSVRSPSVVELVGAGVTGFTGGADADFACDQTNVDTDISSVPAGTRRANCRAWVIALGLAADNASADAFLNGFDIPNSGSRPAAGGSNVGLSNEVADNWTVGVVLQPDFIPGLTISSDWYSIDVKGLMGLTFIVNQCFDSTTFPNSPVGGFNACDSVIPNVSDGMGGFIVPAVHPITGTPTPPVAQPGTPAVSQVAGHNAFVFFPTVNQGLLESRALNNRISYDFELADVFGDMANGWGEMNLTGTALWYKRLRTDGNEAAGEHATTGAATPSVQTRLDATHRLGRLTHQLQWFRQSGTQLNVGSAVTADGGALAEIPSYNRFNYNVAYQFTDNITGRFVVNNLTNNFLAPELGLFTGDPIGRRFVLAIQADF